MEVVKLTGRFWPKAAVHL